MLGQVENVDFGVETKSSKSSLTISCNTAGILVALFDFLIISASSFISYYAYHFYFYDSIVDNERLIPLTQVSLDVVS